jgi:hypothetical protein
MNLGGSWTLTIEAWRLKMEPWRASRPVVAESHHFVEVQDPDLSDADPQTWVQPNRFGDRQTCFLKTFFLDCTQTDSESGPERKSEKK